MSGAEKKEEKGKRKGLGGLSLEKKKKLKVLKHFQLSRTSFQDVDSYIMTHLNFKWDFYKYTDIFFKKCEKHFVVEELKISYT